MATLVQFLAAGVKGAEGGTAEFRIRGTVTSAASVLWEQFEEETQPGQNIFTLDSNGALEMYCDALCDVILRNEAGAILRTVTIGNSAPLVEVKSQSFTGTAYDGDPANTAGEPTTLQAILDKWLTSAGATDWRVLFNGAPVNIQAALASVASTFFNVKDPAYGAIGDGVTDDTTAILSACADADAAGGGIVFFPPGTYLSNGLDPTGANLMLLGCGPGASILRCSSAVALLEFNNTTENSFKRASGLGFSAAGAQCLIEVRESQVLSIDNCDFVCANVGDVPIRRDASAGLTRLTISNCTFSQMGENGIRNSSAPGQSAITVDGCTFTTTAAFVGSIIQGPNFTVSKCTFDCSDVEDNAHYHVAASAGAGRYIGTFTGNTFISNGAANGYAFGLSSLGTDCDFTESDNLFIGFPAPSLTAELGSIYDISDPGTDNPGNISLGSRKGRFVYLDNTATTFVASACLVAETVVIRHDASDDLDVTVPALIPGLYGRVVVEVLTGNANNSVEFLGEQVENLSRAIITAGTIVNQIMGASVQGTEICSCGYNTMASVGGYCSLITGIFDHSVAV